MPDPTVHNLHANEFFDNEKAPFMPPTPWWKNSRGELFVLGQSVLFALLIFGPRTLSSLPVWNSRVQAVSIPVGLMLMVSGLVMAAAGTFSLGRNLTPFICPKARAVLLERGVYGLVRHPIYSGLLQMAFGWGLWVQGVLTLGYGLLLFVVFNSKSCREETILLRTFPGYAAYAAKVKRLVPFIY